MPTKQNPVASGFGPATTAQETLHRVDLTGNIVIVTGGYAGIGLESTRALAGAGATVIVAVRGPEKAHRHSEGFKPNARDSYCVFRNIFPQTLFNQRIGDLVKIAFLGVRVPGHLYPMTTLSRKLKARGHDVVFISVLDTEPFVTAANLPFVPFCEEDFPLGAVRKAIDHLSKLQGHVLTEVDCSSILLVRLLNWYLEKLTICAQDNSAVAVAIHDVVSLSASPRILLEPRLVGRVLAAALSRHAARNRAERLDVASKGAF
jgi:hypothetical protein